MEVWRPPGRPRTEVNWTESRMAARNNQKSKRRDSKGSYKDVPAIWAEHTHSEVMVGFHLVINDVDSLNIAINYFYSDHYLKMELTLYI